MIFYIWIQKKDRRNALTNYQENSTIPSKKLFRNYFHYYQPKQELKERILKFLNSGILLNILAQSNFIIPPFSPFNYTPTLILCWSRQWTNKKLNGNNCATKRHCCMLVLNYKDLYVLCLSNTNPPAHFTTLKAKHIYLMIQKMGSEKIQRKYQRFYTWHSL